MVMIRRVVCLGALVFALAVPGLLSPAAEDKSAPVKNLLSVEDLYLFDSPRSAVLAPDGKSIAYVRYFLDAKEKKERTSLWRADSADKAQAMEEGQPDARAPVFSPD